MLSEYLQTKCNFEMPTLESKQQKKQVNKSKPINYTK